MHFLAINTAAFLGNKYSEENLEECIHLLTSLVKVGNRSKQKSALIDTLITLVEEKISEETSCSITIDQVVEKSSPLVEPITHVVLYSCVSFMLIGIYLFFKYLTHAYDVLLFR